MNALLALSRAIDALNERIGRAVYWLVLVAVLISAANAIVRKAFDMSTNAFLEMQWYLFSAIFLLCAGLHAAAQRAHPHRRHRRPLLAGARRPGSTSSARSSSCCRWSLLILYESWPWFVRAVAAAAKCRRAPAGSSSGPPRSWCPSASRCSGCRASRSSSSASRSSPAQGPIPHREDRHEDRRGGARRGDPPRARRGGSRARDGTDRHRRKGQGQP